MAFDFPQDLLGADTFVMAVVPGGDEQLAVRSGPTVRTLAHDMSSGASFEILDGPGDVAASEQFLHATALGEKRVRCLTHDGTEVASYEDPDKNISCPTLAPCGILFCVLYEEDDDTQDEIIALDAQTMELRYRFGLSLLNDVRGMVMVGEELFLCDKGNDRLQVFSLAGEHRRSITGDWKRPIALCFVKDRLYLVEEQNDNTDEEGELINPIPGRRILVLSLQGDTLEVYTNPVEEQTFTESLCYFDSKLLAPVQLQDAQSGIPSEVVGVLALRGL